MSKFGQRLKGFFRNKKSGESHSGEALKALYGLAKTAMQSRDYQSALTLFQRMIAIDPSLEEVHFNLASCAIELEDWAMASSHYFNVLELRGSLAQDPDLFFNLGVCLEKLGDLPQSERFYEMALALKKDHFSARFNRMLLRIHFNQIEDALKDLNVLKQLHPFDERLSFHEARLKGEALARLPESHIQSLFDQYADHYDRHLKSLEYDLPNRVVDWIEQNQGKKLIQALSVLDLGCGTGLLREAFGKKGEAWDWIGVDLSGNMLEKAREKGGYDGLVQREILEWLEEAEHQFSIVFALEVLNYQADLKPFFEKIKRKLAPGGYLIFSTEIQGTKDVEVQGKGFYFQSNGRYAHNQNYVKSWVAEMGLRIIDLQSFAGRIEKDSKIENQIWVVESLY